MNELLKKCRKGETLSVMYSECDKKLRLGGTGCNKWAFEELKKMKGNKI